MAKWASGADLSPYQEGVFADMNDFDHYQAKAKGTAIYAERVALPYLSLGLAGEAGEFAGKIAKHYRDQTRLDDEDLVKELGDMLWFVSQMADYLGYDLSEVADRNLKKLADRKDRGVIGGSGDNR